MRRGIRSSHFILLSVVLSPLAAAHAGRCLTDVGDVTTGRPAILAQEAERLGTQRLPSGALADPNGFRAALTRLYGHTFHDGMLEAEAPEPATPWLRNVNVDGFAHGSAWRVTRDGDRLVLHGIVAAKSSLFGARATYPLVLRRLLLRLADGHEMGTPTEPILREHVWIQTPEGPRSLAELAPLLRELSRIPVASQLVERIEAALGPDFFRILVPAEGTRATLPPFTRMSAASRETLERRLLDRMRDAGLSLPEAAGPPTSFAEVVPWLSPDWDATRGPAFSRERFVDSDGAPHLQFFGPAGLERLADAHFGGQLDRAWDAAKAVVDADTFEALSWGPRYIGSVTARRALRAALFDGEAVRPEYLGAEGYRRAAVEHFGGDLRKAFNRVSATVGGAEEVNRLFRWQSAIGNVQDGEVLRARLFTGDAPRPEFLGHDGYLRFAEAYFGGDLRKAYERVQALFPSPSDITRVLDWRLVRTRGETVGDLAAKIFHEGRVRPEYLGSEGRTRFAEDHFGGDEYIAQRAVWAFLGGRRGVSQTMQWQRTAEEAKGPAKWRDLLFDGTALRESFRGEEGLARFADLHTGGDRRAAYARAREFLGEPSEVLAILGWAYPRTAVAAPAQPFAALTVDEARTVRAWLFDANAVRDTYRGPAGFVRYANDHFGGDFAKAFNRTSELFDSLGAMNATTRWTLSKGQIVELTKLRDHLFDGDNVRPEFQGRDGYRRFAETHFSGDLREAYDRVSAYLGGSVKVREALQWQQMNGTIAEFEALRAQLFDGAAIRPEFNGADGQGRFAEQYFRGNRRRAFVQVSSLLGGHREVARLLGWTSAAGAE